MSWAFPPVIWPPLNIYEAWQTQAISDNARSFVEHWQIMLGLHESEGFGEQGWDLTSLLITLRLFMPQMHHGIWIIGTFTFRAFNRRFCPKRLTLIHIYIHRLAVAAMQDADQHIRSSLGFSILPGDALTCRAWESNQWPSDNTTLALPLIHSHPIIIYIYI